MHTSVRTVVVAEDDGDQRELLTGSLERSGRYRVVGHGETTDETVMAAEAEQPDVVLLDLRLRDSAGQASIPDLLVVAPRATIVAISGFDDHAAHQDALSAGAFAFVAKTPSLYKEQRLAKLLDELCRRFDAMLAGEDTVAPITIGADTDIQVIT